MEKFIEVSDGSIAVPLTVITDESGKQTKITGFDRLKFKQLLKI